MRKVMTATAAATVLMSAPIAFAQQEQLGTAHAHRGGKAGALAGKVFSAFSWLAHDIFSAAPYGIGGSYVR